MCDTMTSHLYHITNGAVVHTLYGHSATRQALDIGDKDESYAEVEWPKNKDAPVIRFPDSWRQASREECITWYSKFNCPDDLIKALLPMAVKIQVVEGKEHLLPNKLPNLKVLRCSDTKITKLGNYPNLEYLYCYGTKITKLGNYPNLDTLYCYNTKITKLGNYPNLKELYCSDEFRETRNK